MVTIVTFRAGSKIETGEINYGFQETDLRQEVRIRCTPSEILQMRPSPAIGPQKPPLEIWWTRFF